MDRFQPARRAACLARSLLAAWPLDWAAADGYPEPGEVIRLGPVVRETGAVAE